MEVIPSGSKEHIIVNVVDRTKSLTDLSGATPTFKTIGVDDDATFDNWGPTTVIGMNVYCLFDSAGRPIQEYDLFVRFNNAPEVPIIGPYRFKVE